MKALLTFIFILAALPAQAQTDKLAQLGAALDSGRLPALGILIASAGGRQGAAAADFARTSSDDQAWREAELRDLDSLLRGGKYDKAGVNIRREMAKLPGAQWHFVVTLERERRTLYKRLGWGPAGNLYENTYGSNSKPMQVVLAAANPAAFALQRTVGPGTKMEPRLCYERREALTRTMEPVQAENLFRSWKTEALTANMIIVADRRGLRDDLYGGVHEAPCFVYDDGRGRVEIVADAWANSLTPAYTWWYNFDRGTHDYLYSAGGRDWCGQEIQNKAVRAQIDARRAAAKTAAPAAAPKSGTLDGMRGADPF